MEKKYVLLSIEDSKIGALSKVLGNKTCKKIIDLLSEKKEASEKEIAEFLKMPMNTAEYNLKKLIESGLIEKSKNFFWSKKGKKIPMYKLSNKSIIISPKTKITSKLKPILPVAIISAIGTFLLKVLYSSKEIVRDYSQEALKSSASASGANELAPQTVGTECINLVQQNSNIWIWFLSGALLVIILFLIFNWRKL